MALQIFHLLDCKTEAELGAIYLLPDQQGKDRKCFITKGLTVLKGIRKLYIHVEAANEKENVL